MANQGFSRIFSWCETPPGSTKEVECACVPIHNASKLQSLPIDPDLDTTCVENDILVWDGFTWICKPETVGEGVPVPFTLVNNNRLINLVNKSRQYGRVVHIQMNAIVGSATLTGNLQNFVGDVDNVNQRPDTATAAVSVYIPTTNTFFGFEAAVGSSGALFIKPGVTVPEGSQIAITGSYNTILLV